MASIEEKVVSMKFDNKQFEAAISQTITSLDKFKEKLNLNGSAKAMNSSIAKISETLKLDKLAKNVSSGLDKIDNSFSNVKWEKLTSGVDSVAVKMRTLETIGFSVVNNLTNSVVNAAKRIITAVPNQIIQGGITRAMNLEQAKFQLEGLGIAWEAVIDDINYAVDGTAYGLDVAAKAAAQLSASGVQVGEGMKKGLRGISGVAAMTSSSYEDIADVFITVAGNGRVMASELNRISARGINAAAALAKYLNKTEAEVRDMTSKGQIDFATFAAAMDESFGEHAKQANNTFTGALSNMKSALSRIGAEVATPALKNLMNIFNALRIAINQTKADLMPFIGALNDIQTSVANAVVAFVNFGGLNSILRSIGNIFLSIWSVLEPIKNAFADIFMQGGLVAGVLKFSKSLETFTASLRLSDILSNKLYETFRGLFTVVKSVLDVLIPVASVLSKIAWTIFSGAFDFLANVLLTVTSTIGKMIVNVRSWIDSFLELESVTKLMNTIGSILKGLWAVVTTLTGAFKNLVILVGDTAFSGFLVIFSAIGKIILFALEGINGFLLAIDNFIRKSEIFGLVSSFFQSIVDKVQAVIQKIREVSESFVQVESAQRVLGAIGSAFENLGKAIGKATSKLTPFIKKIGDKAIETASGAFEFLAGVIFKVVDGVSAFIESVKESEAVQDAVFKISNAFGKMASSIRNAAGYVASNFGPAIRSIIDFVRQLYDTIRNTFVSFTELPQVQAALETIKEVFKDVFETSVDIFTKFIEGVASFIDNVKNLNKIDLSEVTNSFMNFYNQVWSVLGVGDKIDSFASLLNAVKNEALRYLKSIADGFLNVRDLIFDFVGTINNKIGTINWDKILGLAAGGSMVYAVTNFARLLGSLTNTAKGISNVAESISGTFESVSGIFEGIKNYIDNVNKLKSVNVKLALIKQVGVTVAMIAGSIAILSLMDQSAVQSAALTIGILTGAMLGLATLFGIISAKFGGGQIVQIQSTMGVLAGAMLGMALSLRILNGVDTDGLLEKVVALGLIIAEIGAVMILLGKYGQYVNDSSKNIMAMAGSMIIFSIALRIIGGMNDAAVGRAMAAISGIIILLGAWTILNTMLSKNESSDNAGKNALKMAGAIVLIAMAVAIIGGTDPAVIDLGLKVIEELLVVMAFWTLLNTAIPNASGAAGKNMLAMAGSIAIMVAAIEVIGRTDPQVIAIGIGVIQSLMFLMGLYTAFVTLASGRGRKVDSEKTILAFGASMMALALAIRIIGTMSPEEAMTGLAVLSILIPIAGLTMTLMSRLGGRKTKGAELSFLAFAASIAILSSAVLALSYLDNDGIGRSLAVITTLMLMFSLMIKMGEKTKIAYTTVIAMGLVIAGLAAVVVILSKLDPDNLGNATACIMALALTMTLMSKMKTVSQKALKSMAIIGLIMGELGLILALMSALGVKGALDNALALSALLLAISGALAILGKVGVNVAAAASSALAISAFIGILTAVITAIGAIFHEFDQLQVYLDTAAKVASQIGEVIGNFIGSIIGSIVETSLDKATNGIQKLAETADDLDNFFAVLSKCNVNTDVILSISTAILEFAAADFIGGINNIIGAKSQVAQLPEIGKAINKFSEETKGISASSTESAANAAKVLAEFASNIPTTGGFINAIIGNHDIEGFSKGLKGLGKAIKDFSNEVKDINPEVVTSAGNAAKVLAELNEKLPKTGGFLQGLIGETTDFTKWSAGLKGLGEAIKAFETEINKDGGINAETVVSAGNAAKVLAELNDKLPKSGGFLQGLIGETTTLEAWAPGLAALGGGIVAFNNAIAEASFDEAKANIALKIANSVAGIDTGKLSPVINLFGGGTLPLDTFGEHIGKLGSGLAVFAGCITGVSDNALSKSEIAVGIAQKIGEINTGEVPGFLTMLQEHSADLTNFASHLGYLGDGISAFVGAIEDVEPADISKAHTAANVLKVIGEIETGTVGGVGVHSANLSEWSAQLGTVATNVATFCSEISGITDDSVTKAKSLAVVLSVLGGMDTSGAEKFADQSLANGISGLATAVKNFSTDLDGIDNLGDLGKQINTLFESLKASAELLTSVFDGDPYGFITLCQGLPEAATNLQVFASNMEGVDFETNVVPGFEAIKTFVEDAKVAFAGIKGFDFTVIDQFVDAISKLATSGSTAIVKGMDEIDTAMGLKAQQLIESYTTTMTDALVTFEETLTAKALEVGSSVSTSFEDAFVAALTASETVLTTQLTMLINDLASKISDSESTGKIKEATRTLMKAMHEGASDPGIKSSVEDAVKGIVSSLPGIIKGYRDSFYSAGSYIAGGLAAGINSRAWEVQAAANKLASAAESASRNALQINSPSRVFMNIGKGIPEGMAVGITKFGSYVDTASKDLANNAIEAANKSFNDITSNFNSTKYSPSISPVLNFDASTKSIGSINGVMGLDGKHVNIGANVDTRFMSKPITSVGDMMRAYEENSRLQNEELVTAISELREDVNKLAEAQSDTEFSLYVDGKKMASSLGSPMNKTLGDIERRSDR